MSQYVFGVDIGGTTVKLGLFDLEGNVLDKWEIPTRTQDHGSSILPDIAKSIQDKMTEKSIHKQDVTGVGVGAPGPVDSKGTIYKAVNLGWGVFSIKDTLEEILKIPVMAGNDANVAAVEGRRTGKQGSDRGNAGNRRRRRHYPGWEDAYRRNRSRRRDRSHSCK